jgi:hypothetical protein
MFRIVGEKLIHVIPVMGSVFPLYQFQGNRHENQGE